MLVDSHCHLDFADFDGEHDDLIARAAGEGVGHMVTISTRVRRLDAIFALVDHYDAISCSVGTHPHNADEEVDVEVEDLVRLADRPKVVAIGEAGLDYHYEHASRAAQAQGLRRHIDASRITGLPLVIHSRSADEDMITILEEATHTGGPFPMVLHCFSSGAELARRGVALGAYVSFSGILTFKRSDELRAIAEQVPEDRLLVETDAPYLAPVPFRGRRNEPAFVSKTAETLAHVRALEPARLADITTKNFVRLFREVSLH